MEPASSLPERAEDPRDPVPLVRALSEWMRGTTPPEAAFAAAMEGLRRGAEAERSALLILEGGTMRVASWSGPAGAVRAAVEGFAPWPPGEADPRPVVVEDIRSDGRVASIRDVLEVAGIGSLVCVPLVHRGELVGELLLLGDDGAGLHAHAIRLSEAIVAELAFAVWLRRRDSEALPRSAVAARHAFLEEATRVLNASLELPETFRALAAMLVEEFADQCVIYRRAEPGRIERVAGAGGPEAESGASTARTLRVGGPHPVARVIREGRPVNARTPAETRALLSEAGGELLSAPVPESALILPLMARERAVGALVMVRCGASYSQEEVDLLGVVASRAGIAMDNSLLYEQARTADRAKSNFLAVMSHEFRTPLSAILGYADILTTEVHGELNPLQRGHLERVKASVRHLSHLVDEILTFASMESGRERIRPERVDLVAVVRDVAGIMAPIAEAAGLDLRVSTVPPPVTLETDPSKLRQILINLLSNGIKYTPDGHVEIRLEVAGAVARCAVADTGPGIPADHAEDVFEPFWQVEVVNGRRVSGTGLGLAVARRLSRLLGGDIRLHSEVGVGSEFVLELPLARTERSG